MHTITCGSNDADERKPFHVIRSSIDTVAFSRGGTPGHPGIIVNASIGRRKMTPADTSDCLKGNRVLPKATIHCLEFVFDGHAYKASPPSAKVLGLFKDH
jgi:hypothetical protein